MVGMERREGINSSLDMARNEDKKRGSNTILSKKRSAAVHVSGQTEEWHGNGNT